MLKHGFMIAMTAVWLTGPAARSEPTPRGGFLPVAETSPQTHSPPGDTGISHVAIFRFEKAHIDDATDALRALAAASRKEPGNLAYDIYRGTDDDQAFYIVERWASKAALEAHEHTEAFIHFGQSVLARYATLHDTVTARAFDAP